MSTHSLRTCLNGQLAVFLAAADEDKSVGVAAFSLLHGTKHGSYSGESALEAQSELIEINDEKRPGGGLIDP